MKIIITYGRIILCLNKELSVQVFEKFYGYHMQPTSESHWDFREV